MDQGLVGTVLQLMQETVTNDTVLQEPPPVQMSLLESAKSLLESGRGVETPRD